MPAFLGHPAEVNTGSLYSSYHTCLRKFIAVALHIAYVWIASRIPLVKEIIAEFPEGSGVADRNVNRVCIANKPESASGSQPALGHKLESLTVELSGCTGGRGGSGSGESMGTE